MKLLLSERGSVHEGNVYKRGSLRVRSTDLNLDRTTFTMFPSISTVLLLLLGLITAHCWSVETQSSEYNAKYLDNDFTGPENSSENDENTVSGLIEKANKKVGQGPGEPLVMFGDIAVDTGLNNADPCTARNCTWPKSSDGNVYVPYEITNQYSNREKSVIESALGSFASSTCVRFRPRSGERDYISIESRSGCWSYVGRTRGAQVVSLMRTGCVHHSVIQHEMLHALGFNHEQSRSDRDDHVRILFQNVISGMEHNFRKVQTNNLGTPYDYNSVMHYSRTAFSKNGQPTIVPIPDPRVPIGKATQMSPNDILRVNRLYRCSEYAPTYTKHTCPHRPEKPLQALGRSQVRHGRQLWTHGEKSGDTQEMAVTTREKPGKTQETERRSQRYPGATQELPERFQEGMAWWN
ncbi:low choriolytic enzyme-like [Chanos chanos]|uniref:Metalloendopeptidase n=1 Tax=Chanos chanos TaxID=29144 RepID=A0A6J2WZY1_CHACN|nr:low choriolytic enzyme-like [Chanos chanos]